ncbi:MAG: cytochrome c oxidase assembly protein subunit 15, partial [Planctomycetota bacterium]
MSSSAGTPTRTPRILASILAAATVLALFRDPMFAWQPGVAAILLCFRPRSSIVALAVATSLLLLVGGAVTTYRVGMAVPDWPKTMGQGMFDYPLDEMLASGWGVTLEHSHRLWASLVGLISILVVLTMWFHRSPRRVLLLAVVSLLLVITQGVLGGTRVLANNQQIAFIHGSFAQVFYSTVIALWVVTAARWNTLESGQAPGQARLRKLSDLCVVLVFVQVVLGAWLRHSGLHMPLGFHVLFAFVVFGALMVLAKRLRAAHDSFVGPAA